MSEQDITAQAPDESAEVLDDSAHADPDQPDIGKTDLSEEGEPIGEDLDVGDLDTLIAGVVLIENEDD
jgi:hypothetical protein